MRRPLDPAMLARIAPTELRPGEDPVARFVAELTAVSGTAEVVTRAGTLEALERAAMAGEPRRAILTADLDSRRAALAERLEARGVEVLLYEQAVADRAALAAADVAVTGCQAAVAATGSVLAGGAQGRAGALIAPRHVCLVERRRLFGGLLALLRALPDIAPGSAIALQSGPSRTADIEKTLILGMHGPKAVHAVVVDDPAADGGSGPAPAATPDPGAA